MRGEIMQRFWISWYSIGAEITPPFECWITGESAVPNDDGSTTFTFVADLKAESEQAAYAKIAEYYPDYKERFCEERSEDWKPSDRFQ